MYRVERFRSEDVKPHLTRAADTVLGMGGGWDVMIKAYERQQCSWSIWNQDQWVASGGVALLWLHVAEAWTLMPVDIEKHRREIFRQCKRALYGAEIIHDLYRTQATVRRDQTQWIKYAQKLGFEAEGILKNYGPEGEDYIMMARMRWDQ